MKYCKTIKEQLWLYIVYYTYYPTLITRKEFYRYSYPARFNELYWYHHPEYIPYHFGLLVRR